MIELAPRQSIHIPDPSALAIHCVAGCLWVTQHADTADHILQTGETIQFSGRDLVVTSALGSSILRLAYLRDSVGVRPEIAISLDTDVSQFSPSAGGRPFTKANRKTWRKGRSILLAIAIASATALLTPAGARARIMETVGLAKTHNPASAGSAAEDQATAHGVCAATPKLAVQHLPNPGRERPLQFNFRRY